MKALSGVVLIALSLTLAACGKSEEGTAPKGEAIAAVAPPAGTGGSSKRGAWACAPPLPAMHRPTASATAARVANG